MRTVVSTLLGFSLLATGCSRYEHVPCTGPADCRTGLCVNGWCVVPEELPTVDLGSLDTPERPDAGSDIPADLDAAEPDAPRDEAPDPLDVSPEEDRGEDPRIDQGAPEASDTVQDVPSTLGKLCEQDSDCHDGSCVEWVPGRRICSGPCLDGCPPGMRCIVVAKSAAGEDVTECRPYPGGLCWPCRGAGDCPNPDAQCIPMPGGDFCVVPCAAGSCPAGFSCEVVSVGIPAQCVPSLGTCVCPPAYEGCGALDAPCDEGYRCVTLGAPPADPPGLPPVLADGCNEALGTCTCVASAYGAAFPCAVESAHGRCEGEMRCTLHAGFATCSAPLPEPEICDARDNDCDGKTDEDFSALDWDGSSKPVSGSCGTGVCAGGRVACVASDLAACSTYPSKAVAERCGDGLDNDCDGKTDEGCWPDDLDADGTPNDEDCDPYDSAKHPGAAEPCCAASVPQDLAIQVCDADCDGRVTPCAPGDLDGDGFLAVEAGGNDCDDSDPMVHVGAAERCGDGVDQDCDGVDLPCEGLQDEDHDGYPLGVDCNDDDPDIHPGAQEVCDFVDQDCDGVVDEGNPGDGEKVGGEPCGKTEGICRPGIWVCAHELSPPKAEVICVGGVTGYEEVCDGLDNDCNGLTDETFPDLGLPCDGPDLDRCANGRWECRADGLGLQCGIEAIHDLLEVCGDGKDNDCDGVVDNGCLPEDLDGDGFLPPEDCDDTRAEVHPNAPEPCCDLAQSGAGAVAGCDRNCDGQVTPCDANDRDADGHRSAASGGDDCDDQDASVHPGAPERCGDGVDQDCDGKDLPCDQITDKDQDGYAPPWDCNDSNAGIHPGAQEVCNNKDDDCDGVTDEGNPGGGDPCGSDEGECSAGVTVCVHYPFQARIECVMKQKPSVEVCDGLDNNCNGLTDEFFAGLGEPCDGPDADFCANGTVRCSADGTGVVCVETVENVPEVCNGLDDDCDGQTDEGFTFEGAAIGAPCDGLGECSTGVVVCAPDQQHAICSTMPGGPENQATPEVCDRLDNDCDGLTDNGITYLGQPIGAVCLGVGACGPGTVECNPTTKKATCSSNPDGSKPKAKPEVCNGLDDDCDGHTDEGLTPRPGDCKGAGVCAGVAIPAKCRKGQWECDYSGVPDYEPDETLCDGLDNDCDAQTDEGYPIGLPCDGPDSDRCKNGTYTCTPDHHGWECVNETVTDIVETCNGLDDDCDDLVDEDFPVGEPCDGPDSDECKNGTWSCAPDGSGVECVNETVTDIVETCNGLDDDCDGRTDEDWPVGSACDGPDSDLCANGTWSCLPDGSGVECANETVTDIVEACNGLDDDCDGLTDEGFSYDGTPVGGACDGIGACGPGVVVCDPLGVAATCSTNPDGTTPQAVPEVCDGLDNDCDGRTDEDLTYDGIPLGEPCFAPGECGPGVVVCSPVDLTATCSSAANGTEPCASPEVCDLKDNDCDGLTDDIPVPDKSSCLLTGVCTPDLVQASCVEGRWVCSYEGVPGFEPGLEVTCDGLDNNCDGRTDEAYPIGEPCDGPDSDLCANGRWVCSADAHAVECGPESPANLRETCNALDDDCDGLTDEEGAEGCGMLFIDQDADGHGAGTARCLCAPGQIPGFTSPVGDDCDDQDPRVHPGHAEWCDGLDNDCNGKTDETFADLGRPCDGPDPDHCENGTWTCAPDGLTLECGNDLNVPETCNGRDDDCDGQTDEEWPVGQPCDGPDSDLCKNGTWTCTSDHTGVECVNETVTDIREACNGRDDDCDGQTDEDWPDKGKGCVVGVGECQRTGLWVCSANGSGVVCNATPGQASAEVCDNKDNDCNGTTDDPWIAYKGRKCDTNPSPPAGVPACALGLWQCRPDKTGLQCIGDVECVTGDQCLSSGSEFLPDSCLCGMDDQCTALVANQCTPAPACLCGSGPRCTPPLQCVSGTCK